MKFAAVGFTCIDSYKNLGISYPTGNGVDLMFNLMEQIPDIEPALVTAIGDDEYGKVMLEECRLKQVNTDHITVVPGGQTAIIEMLLNGKDRVHHRADKGVMIEYQPSDADMEFIQSMDIIHTDFSWKVVPLLPKMREKGTKVYFDFSKRFDWPEVPEVLKNINYGIFSFEEETQQVRDLLKMGCELGAEVLIATFGEKGSLAYDGKEFYRCGIVEAENLVNTVGAGDSFGSGFLAGIISGKTVPESMLMGAKKSAQIVSMFEPYKRGPINR